MRNKEGDIICSPHIADCDNVSSKVEGKMEPDLEPLFSFSSTNIISSNKRFTAETTNA